MQPASIIQRLKQLGSTATVAVSVLMTQPSMGATPDLVMPLLQSALASVASKSERNDGLPGPLVLDSHAGVHFEFVGHRSHRSHSSHSSHHSSSGGSHSFSTRSSYSPSVSSPGISSSSSSRRPMGFVDNPIRPAPVESPPKPAPPPPAVEMLASERLKLLSIKHHANGLFTVRVFDRKTEQEQTLSLYERIDRFILVSIDPKAETATFVDSGSEMASVRLHLGGEKSK